MIEGIDANGSWSTVTNGGIIYHTAAGAVVSWWQKSGKILVQGPDGLRRAMRAAISAAIGGSTADEAGSAATKSPPEQPWHTFEMIVKVRRSN